MKNKIGILVIIITCIACTPKQLVISNNNGHSNPIVRENILEGYVSAELIAYTDTTINEDSKINTLVKINNTSFADSSSSIVVYPKLCIESGIEGRLVISISLDESERIKKIDVLRDDYNCFKNSVLESLKQFPVGTKLNCDNKNTNFIVIIYQFKIREKK